MQTAARFSIIALLAPQNYVMYLSSSSYTGCYAIIALEQICLVFKVQPSVCFGINISSYTSKLQANLGSLLIAIAPFLSQ